MNIVDNHNLRVAARVAGDDLLCESPEEARTALADLATMIQATLDADSGAAAIGDYERSTLYVQIEIALRALAALIPEAT